MRRTISSIFLSPQFLLLIFGVFFALLWHFSILYVSPFSWMDNRGYVRRLFFLYVAIHACLVLAVSLLPRKRFGGFYLGIALAAGYCLVLVTRALDWNVLYYYGGHVDVLFWDNAFYSTSTGMMFTKVAMLGTLCVLVGTAVVYTLMRRTGEHRARNLAEGMPLLTYLALFCFIPPVVLVVLGNFWIQTFFTGDGTSAVYTRYPPEFHFAQSLADFAGQGYAEKVELTEEQKSKLASMGLQLETVSTEYPLLKSSVYLDESPSLPKHDTPPNVVLVMSESLSSFFIEDAEMQALGLMPNVRDFQEQSLNFSNIINASTPTLQGQIATLSSSLHLFKTTMDLDKRAGHEDVDEQDSSIEGSAVTRYPYLSVLLKEHGYESMHVHAGFGRFADTEQYFRFSGQYDNFVSVTTSQFKDRKQYKNWTWGARDSDTFTVASQWLDERTSDQPFLLTVATADLHHPYEHVVSAPGVDNDLLNCVYSADNGFGVLWDYFKNSRYKDNTIFIFTADHALFPTAEYLEIRQEDVGYYDNIPLMIYSPFHDSLMATTNDIRGSQLDLAPTVFELLGLDSQNSFIGLSLLSDRKDYPYLFGKVNLETRINASNGIPWSRSEHTELIKYIRYLASMNRLYPGTDPQM